MRCCRILCILHTRCICSERGKVLQEVSLPTAVAAHTSYWILLLEQGIGLKQFNIQENVYVAVQQ